MVIHAFGAVAGVVLCIIYRPRDYFQHPYQCESYESNIIGMIGSIFMWVLWPSFNTALGVTYRKDLAQMNTFLSLVAANFTGIAFSILFNLKLKMGDLINSTLAGGVVVGASADVILNPAAALVCGALGGFISALGFNVITPKLPQELSDTAGVLNLHCMVGIFGGIYSAIIVAFLNTVTVPAIFTPISTRTFPVQGGYQFACTLVSIGIGAGTGVVTGLILYLARASYERQAEEDCYEESQQRIEKAMLYHDYTEWDIELIIEDKEDFLRKEEFLKKE
jgi:ammonium transporter Rh